jgi:hypothetical protein
MNSLRSAALGLAVLAFAGVGFAQSASADDMMMSHHDKSTMKSCMHMTDEHMMKSHKCSMMMKKMNMSSDDMHAMQMCKGMSHDAMMADQKCMSMMKSHGMM